MDLFRGLAPIACVVLARAFARPLRHGNGLAEASLISFCLIAGLSSVWSDSFTATAFKAIQMTGAALAVLYLVRYYPSSDRAVQGLATACHGLLIATGIQWAFFPANVYVSEEIGLAPRLGSSIPQVSANPLAFVAVAGLAGLLLRVGPRLITNSTLVTISLGGLYVAELIGTRTRSGIAVGILMVAVAFFSLANRRAALVLNTVLAILITLVWLGPRYSDSVRTYLTRGQDRQALSTLTGRTNIWGRAIDAWQDDKLLGLGYFYGHRASIPGLPPTQSNLDSTWIEALVDVGVVGAAALALFFASGFVRLLRGDMERDAKLWSVLVGLYGLAISFVNPTIQAPGGAMVLLAFVLLANGAGRRIDWPLERGPRVVASGDARAPVPGSS
ncbi:O-antigen ligase [Marmoricola sp. Leaf446]|uniref:O-antigen ligase family protein n=1 Tax=Marmoricola sp. Leaf446 TaxID=1736379 RepID=UPI00138F6B60|nr:O-antigen ligase family protein [Marmoricola sp. Leaf446]